MSWTIKIEADDYIKLYPKILQMFWLLNSRCRNIFIVYNHVNNNQTQATTVLVGKTYLW